MIALMDTSQSLHGDPELLAKANVLLLTRRMIKEERPMKEIQFSSTGQTIEYDMTTKNTMSEDFLQFLNVSFGGDNDFCTAVKYFIDKLRSKEWNASDVAFIFDGPTEAGYEIVRNSWNSLKQTNDTRLFGLIVGNDRPWI